MGQGGRSTSARKESKTVTASQLNKRFGETPTGYNKKVLSNTDRVLLTKAAGRGKTKVAKMAKQIMESGLWGRQRQTKKQSAALGARRPGEKGVASVKGSKVKYGARARKAAKAKGKK